MYTLVSHEVTEFSPIAEINAAIDAMAKRVSESPDDEGLRLALESLRDMKSVAIEVAPYVKAASQ